MAGLLDFLETPDAQLGIGLLAAGGPVTDPNASGFGARLASGVGYAQNAKAAATRQRLIDSQIAENESQNAQRAAALARQAQMDAYYLGGGVAAPGAPSATPQPGLFSAAPDVGAPGAAAAGAAPNVEPGAILKAATGAPAGAPPPSQGKFAEWSRAYGIPIDALISDYRSNGGKGIADMLFKRGAPVMKESSGGYIYDENKVQPGFLPGLKQAADGTAMLSLPDPTAPGGVRVMAPAGALGTAGGYAEQKARIGATYTPGRPVLDPASGYPVGQSQLKEVGLGTPAPAPAGGPLIGRSPGGVQPRGGFTGTAEEIMAAIDNSPVSPAVKAEMRGAYAAQVTGKNPAFDAMGTGALPPSDMLPGLPGAGRGAVNPPAAAAPPAAPLIGPGASAIPVGAVDYSPAAKAEQAAAQEFKTKLASEDVAQLKELSTAATAGQSAIKTASSLRRMAASGIFEGGGAGAKTAAASMIAGLTGITPKALPGSEAYNAEASNLVLGQIKALGTNPSNTDREFIMKTIPQIETSPAARSAMLDFMEAKGREAIDGYKRADAYARKNGGLAGYDRFAELEGAPKATWTPPPGVKIREVK